jgi:hypothetical protein
MLVGLNNFLAIAVTAFAFAFCGWFIAGDTGAVVSAALSLAMFLRPTAASNSLPWRPQAGADRPSTPTWRKAHWHSEA